MRSWVRFVLSFLIIAMICVLTIAGGAHVLYGDYCQRQIEARFQAELAAAAAEADALLETFFTQAQQLGELCDSLWQENSAESRQQMTSLLNSVIPRMDSELEIALFVRSDPRHIYTRSGCRNYSDYEKALAQYGVKPNLSRIFSSLLRLRVPALSRDSASGLLVLMIPVGSVWSPYAATLMALLPENVLFEPLLSSPALSGSDIYITDKLGGILLQSGQNIGVAVSSGQLASASRTAAASALELDGNRLVLCRSGSSSGLAAWHTVTPRNTFYRDWRALSGRLLFIALLVLSLAFLLSIVLGVSHYLPLRRAYTNIAGSPPKRGDNELETIVSIYKQATDSVAALESRQDANLSLVRRQLLLSMINHTLRGGDELADYAKGLLLPLNKAHWCAFYLFLPDAGVDGEQTERTLYLLENYGGQTVDLIFAELQWESGVGVIANYDALSALSVAQALQGYLEDRGVRPLILGVGSQEGSPAKMHLSFYRALSAARRWSPAAAERIFTYAAQPGETALCRDMTLFAEALSYGSAGVALSEMDRTLQETSRAGEGRAAQHLIRCDLLNTLLHAAARLNIALDRETVLEAASNPSPEVFYEEAKRLTLAVCQGANQRLSENDERDRSRLLTYFADNYKRNDLSLRTASEELSLSVARINGILKEYANCSFVQYIWLLRLNEFKRLLRERDDSIQSLVQEVGYIDVSSFMRKFKAAEGISPGAYRQQYAPQRKQ